MWWVFRPPMAESLKLANLTTERAAGQINGIFIG